MTRQDQIKTSKRATQENLRLKQRRIKLRGLVGQRLDGNVKARIVAAAIAWSNAQRRVDGSRSHIGPLTRTGIDVMHALLGYVHAKTGHCYPSLGQLADRAHCVRSTVQRALDALAAAGVLSWAHRIKVVRVGQGTTGRWASETKALRASNVYFWHDPAERVMPEAIRAALWRMARGAHAQRLIAAARTTSPRDAENRSGVETLQSQGSLWADLPEQRRHANAPGLSVVAPPPTASERLDACAALARLAERQTARLHAAWEAKRRTKAALAMTGGALLTA